jgi:predicted SnoaL-like aldol condensation-catalyzing enzyme
VPDSKEGFVRYFERMSRQFSGKRVKFKRLLAEATTSSCYQHWPGDHDHAGIDIFRMDERAESWSIEMFCR